MSGAGRNASGTVYSAHGMSNFLRLALRLLSCFLLLPCLAAGAQPQVLHRVDRVQVCPAAAGDTAPPDFSAPTCRHLPFHAVDSQQAYLWLAGTVTLPRTPQAPVAPQGLYVSGKAASTAWINGHRIGSNGQPGRDAGSEIPGQMDIVLPIPPGVLRPGANTIVLKLSGQHGLLHLDTPLHLLAVGEAASATDLLLRGY